MSDLYTGQLVKLRAGDPETDPKIMEVWHRDTEFFRLGYGRIAKAWGTEQLKHRLEEGALDAHQIKFAINAAEENNLIGQIGMWVDQPHGDGSVWILIGERDYWGKGYGADAMRVFMRYAFTEWNLHRLSLRVFGLNTRAIRSYEKCGFVREGAHRGAINKVGQRWDDIWMGILKSEWLEANADLVSAGDMPKAA